VQSVFIFVLALNCLKATSLHLCFSLNFGKPRLEINRVVQGL
jgi:hypothetical protein